MGNNVIWKPIPGWEELYEVSDTGQVKSLGRSKTVIKKNGNPFKVFKRGRILKTHTNKLGYAHVILTDMDGKQHMKYVHRLVAITFIPNPDNLNEVDHINRIRNDNRPENLRWVTRTENVNNQERHYIKRLLQTDRKSLEYGRLLFNL